MEDHLYLAHHGVKGMKWGVRRFQNKDGSLTSAGKKRYYGPIGAIKSFKNVVSGDIHAKRNAKASRAAASKRRWDRDTKLDEDYDDEILRIRSDQKSGKITKKEAKRQSDEAYEKWNAAINESARQHKVDKRNIRTAQIEEHAQARLNESNRILNEHKNTYGARRQSDELRGTATIIQSRADVRKARDAYKANRTPETRRAYHEAVAKRVIAVNYAATPSAIGAYNRYRDNGASIAAALLKAGTAGSMFKHGDM